MDPRGVPRRSPRPRSRRPQRLRRPAADPAAGFGAAKRSRSSTGTPNPPCANRSRPWHRAGSSPKPGTSCCSDPRHRQDPPGHRPGHRGRAPRPPGAVRDRDDWVTRLTDAHRAGRLPNELTRLRRCGLIIVDEVGYLPFEQDAANLFFQLVSSRYEHASLVLTSNLPFSGWGGVSATKPVAAAMIDRVVHHADVLTPQGRQLPAATAESTPCPA